MKKNNKKGFIFAETIIISVVVLGALIFIYTQFMSINKSYQNSFRYNTVDKLYATKNIVEYVKTDGLDTLTSSLTGEYIDITSCSSDYFLENKYCEDLYHNLGIKTVLFAKEDVTELKKQQNLPFTEEMKSYLKTIPSKKENRYRIIAEFKDNTFATLKFD